MNLLLLAVWCGLMLQCTVSLPRRRQIKYPVTKFQNAYYERSHPTALEILERTLLQPSEKGRSHNHPHSGRKRSVQQCGEESTSPLYSDISSKEEDSRVDGCVASFGDQSPLCKPRNRQKKSFVGIPDIHKRLFRGVKKNMTMTTSNSLEDFFGVFKVSVGESQSNASFTNNDMNISKLNVSPLITSVYAVPSNSKFTTVTTTSKAITNKTTTGLTMVQMNSARQSSEQPTTLGPNANASSVYSGVTAVAMKNDFAKIILPGSVQKIESEPQLLYLERIDNPQNVPINDLYTREIEETESGTVTVSESTSEEEYTTETEPTTRLTIPPLKKSFLKGETYSKTLCEKEKKKPCICSLSSVDSDFQTIFSKAIIEEQIMAEVSNMKCRRYTTTPSVFDLNTNAKPRVLKGKGTPFAVDNKQGAKEVTERSLDDFIAFSVLDDGITRVFVSSDVKIPCFPKPDIHLSATDADHVKFTWTFGNKKQTITQGRITEDTDGDGSLIIQDIELTDAMNYSCEIDYIHPDTGERTTDTFIHSLSVVTLPTVSARAVVHYRSSAACDESLLEMFEMYLPQQVEKTICSTGNNRLPLCTVVVHSPVCHNEAEAAAEQDKSKREAVEENLMYWYREKRESSSMEMSLNFDVFIHRLGSKELPGNKARLCSPDCHLLINFKLLQFFKESAQEMALIPIISKVQGGGKFTPVPSSVKVKYIFGCIGGYYLDNGFCLACPKGMYSDDGATECQSCPLHTYSAFVGTRRCTPCKHLWMPICNEHFESLNIRMIVYVLIAVSLMLGAFVVYYVFWYKGQTWQEVWKKGPAERVAKSERVKSRKKAKREKEKKQVKLATKEELEPMMESTGNSEEE